MKTIVCIGSGPSLTEEQVKLIGSSPYYTIAINNSFKLADWCDMVFAADLRWWYEHYYEVIHTCLSASYFTLKGVASHFEHKKGIKSKIKEIDFDRGEGLGEKKVVHGGNSGYIAVNLAYLMGADKIVLVGYDHQHTYGKTHWHGDHDKKKFTQNANDIDRWLRNFDKLAYDLEQKNVDLVNCSIETAITSCRRSKLEIEL